jgi:hypothetical protein
MGPKIEAGQFVKFFYNPPVKPPKQPWRQQQVTVKQADGTLKTTLEPVRNAAPPPPPSDKNKEVFVLHPSWQGKIQALDTKRLTPAQVQVLHAVMDPEVKAKVDAGQWPIEGVPQYPLIRDTLRRVDPPELIKNPIACYQQLIRPFIGQTDCYRTFWPQYVANMTVIKETTVVGKVTNPAPLFHK